MRALRMILGLLVILAAGFVGLRLTERLMAAAPDAAPAERGAAAPLKVDTIRPETVVFADAVSAVGTARAHRAVDLMPPSAGRVTRIAFRAGDRVDAGQMLVELDDRAERADLAAAEASLVEARAAFDRQQSLNRTGNVSDAAYQTAQADLLRAEAERDRREVTLEDRSLEAPFAGTVGLTNLVEGQVIDMATTATTLDDPSTILVEFAVPESVMPRLERGQAVELTSAAWPGRVFRAGIRDIDNRVDEATRSLALRAELDNRDGALAGGMFLQVRLILEERSRPAVPESALVVNGDQTLVMVAQGGTARQIAIVPGGQRDGLVEVVSGLPPDAQVIVSNLHRVSDGAAIDPVARDRQAAMPPSDNEGGG